MAKSKTYPVEVDGRKTRVTIPERHDHVAYEGEPADVLRDVLKDSLSPQAVAAVANAVRVQLNGDAATDTEWRPQVEWVAAVLVDAVGGEAAYHRICHEAGL